MFPLYTVAIEFSGKSKGLDFISQVASRPLGSNYGAIQEPIKLTTVDADYRYNLAAHFQHLA